MSGNGNSFQHVSGCFSINNIPGSLLACLLLMPMLGSIISGCAASTVSFQPEIESTAKEDLKKYKRVKNGGDTEKDLGNLPQMNAASHEALGDAMIAQDNFQSAYSHYKKAYEKTSGHDQTRLKYKQGMTFLYSGKYDAANRIFETVLTCDPDFASAHEGIGRIHLKRGDLTTAKTHFQKAVALNADLWLSQNCLGMIYDNERAWEKAAKAYKNALATNPQEGSVLNNLGTSYLLSGKDHLAVKTLKLAIQSGLSERRAFNNLGLALARTGRFDEALQAFEKAVGEAAAYNNLGCVHLKNDRRRMAIECFEKAMALDKRFYVTASQNLERAGISVNTEIGEIQ